jgi:hypothetical protein
MAAEGPTSKTMEEYIEDLRLLTERHIEAMQEMLSRVPPHPHTMRNLQDAWADTIACMEMLQERFSKNRYDLTTLPPPSFGDDESN